MKILIVNPGSTSTKIGLFEDEVPIFEKVLRHTMDELAGYEKIGEQYDFRMKIIMDALKEAGVAADQLAAVCGMGGLTKPIPSGTYYVNDAMKADLASGNFGDHASNLGGLIARAIGDAVGIPSFIVDPVVVDEFIPISRISGHPALTRRSIFHALNQKATARKFCKEIGRAYDEVNLVVVHMGGGISVTAHQKGRAIDSNNALDGDGPFTPERSGTLPVGDLAALCYSGKYTHGDVKAMIKGKGGMVGYFGTNNLIELEERAKTDPDVKLIVDALAMQVGKEIACQAVALCGDVDAIILTGGIAYSDYITGEIARRVEFIAPVKRYPGEDELAALNAGALRVMRCEEEGRQYE
ncbi:MAG: butyrate kinase [Clostridiales bacterium]|jgi:butyrate kinase|nr:butyrate kinase [Clostridiales bacterium]